MGVQGRNGARLAVETINAAGGVRGKPLRLEPHDDQSHQQVARELVRTFRKDGVEVVIGPMTSVAGVAVAELVAESGPLYVSPTVSTAEVSGRDDFFVRLQAAHDLSAAALGAYAVQDLGVARVAVIADTTNAEYSTAYADAFSHGLAAEGGEVVREFAINLSQRGRWNHVIQAIAREDPQGVLIVGSATDTARFSQALRSVDHDWHLLGSGWAATEALTTMGGEAVHEMTLAKMSYPALETTPEGADFQQRFLQRFGRVPSFAAGNAYDAVMVVARALEDAGVDAEELRTALVSLDRFDTLTGRLTVNEYGDVEPSAEIVRVERGQFVHVTDYGVSLGQ